jgi:proteasome lid subunit RPN8/RPN11
MSQSNRRGLRLSNQIMKAMLEHAHSEPRTEVCGLLGGRDFTLAHYYPVSNIAADTRREYLMEPKQQIDAMRRMRERGEELLAIFHSHPDTEPQPSETDLARAAYPDTIYLIAGPAAGGMQLNAFYYDGAGFTPVELHITDNQERDAGTRHAD